jgi:hypothetical protein
MHSEDCSHISEHSARLSTTPGELSKYVSTSGSHAAPAIVDERDNIVNEIAFDTFRVFPQAVLK